MVDIFSLTCPSCGGKLQLTPDIERFACGYCGSELLVRKSGGIVTLAPVVAELKGVKQGVDRTASELAIVRLQKEIKQLESQIGEIDPAFLYEPEKFSHSNSFWIGIFLFAVVILASFNMDDGFSVFLCFGSLITSGMIVAYITHRGRKILYRKSSKSYYELKQELDKKEKALARHKSIVAE